MFHSIFNDNKCALQVSWNWWCEKYSVDFDVCVCVVQRTRRGCQVGSLLLLCHYSSSLFHSFSNFLTQVSEIIFRVWCRRERLDEVKPFPDFSSLQSKLPPHRKIYPCPILEKPLDGKSAPIQDWKNHLMLLPPRSSWNAWNWQAILEEQTWVLAFIPKSKDAQLHRN